MTAVRHGAASHTGMVRSVNQDASLVAEPLFAVADGMGGAAAGEVASQVAIEAVRNHVEPSAEGLAHAVRVANRAVWDRAQDDPAMRGMGTTMCAIVLAPSVDGEGVGGLGTGTGTVVVANVGDSRVYLLHDGDLEQVTDDHSLVEDLVRQGRITHEEARTHPQRNIVTRVLGGEDDVEVDIFQIDPYVGDRFLLCSDGLFNEVEDERIAGVLRRLEDPDDAAAELVRLANEAGGRDNITVVIVDVVDDGGRAEAASAALAGEPGAGGRPAGPGHEGDTAGQATTAVPSARGAVAVAAPPAPAPAPSDAGATSVVESRQQRRARRAREARPRRFTWRVAVFVLAVLAVLGAAAAAIAWFATGTYFVGVDGEDVVIYRGRPGGVLWIEPTLEERTGLTLDDVPPARQPDVLAGKQSTDLDDARRYVARLEDQARRTTGASTTTTAPTGEPSPGTSTTVPASGPTTAPPP